METYAFGLGVERLSGERIFGNLVLIKLFLGRGTKQFLFIIYIPVVGFENDTPKGGHTLLCRNGWPRGLWLSIGYGFQVL